MRIFSDPENTEAEFPVGGGGSRNWLKGGKGNIYRKPIVWWVRTMGCP